MRRIRILAYSLLFSLQFGVLAGANDPTQEVREATFLYPVSPGTEIVVDGKNTHLSIETWNRDEVEVYALLEFKGKMISRVEEFLMDFEKIVGQNIRKSSISLTVSTDFNRPNKVQLGTRVLGTQIGFGDDELSITYRLKVPSGNDLDISNSYEDLIITGNYDGEVKIEHYSGDLVAGSFDQLELNLKYGQAQLVRANEVEMTLYEQDLEMQHLGNGRMDCKYSKLNIGSIEELDLDSYESRIRFQSATSLFGILKYGSLEISERIGKMDLESIYELEVEVRQADLIKLRESKYCDFRLGQVGRIEQLESYEDNVDIDMLNELEAVAKYSEYVIGELGADLDVTGYECNVEIEKINRTVGSISMSGKYCKLDLETDGIPFHLDANIQYGDIDYPDGMERSIFIKESSRTEMKMSRKNAGTQDLKVMIRGYEMDARIE